ncbi:DUF4943 family protein [Cyclobacterium qasimii]|uniref:DUF4943 domain-containing protein n=2 Tax=Cyclobacterium qasimii TaxID=1350429 RepID=S7VDF1_9BACT|nr:DUF4943 family protein [Cyclobacterium qasimii]EPR68240.1 hypothetical protein ADICYQ_2710 [Cyclobacterium qasimii M12-11B]GEO19813.1 hypothetical protein CQA01_03470 [Cyclobacterium qasimii]
MKNLKWILSIFSLLILSACDKSDEELSQVTEVSQYVDLLIKEKYTALELPSFTAAEIPDLLDYRNSNQKITVFPRNWISSYATNECTLGMYVLWTIESIRAVANNSDLLIGRFPSQNPIVQKREAEFELVYDEESQKKVADAYMKWWQKNQDKQFQDFKDIDPLLDTGLRWH